MSTSKWFDRKFDFSIGIEDYPALYKRLQQAPDALAAILLNMPDNLLSHQPNGKWSVKEHTGHLSILESLWRTRIHDIMEKKPMLTPTDLDNTITSQAGFNNYDISALITKFGEERKQTLSLLDSIHIQDHKHASLHPRMQQPMRLIDILYFTAEHDDHHLGVIGEIINQGQNASNIHSS